MTNLENEVTLFGRNNLTVRLVWSRENGASYNVSVVPSVSVDFTAHTTVEISLAYNTLYNVSITTTICGRRSNSSTTFFELNYSKVYTIIGSFVLTSCSWSLLYCVHVSSIVSNNNNY